MRSHTGFTLIELLISIALGVTILLATTRIFIDSRESFLVQQQWTLLHEKGRHAIQFLTTELQMAGYPKTTFSGTPLSGSEAGGPNQSDSLTLSYQGATDCAGSSTTTIRYYLDEESLRCDGNGSASPTPQSLTTPIDGLQFRYGVDSDGDGSINRYQRANQVSDWNQVLSVEFALLLRSELKLRQSTEPQSYDLLEISHGPFNDGYLRKVYGATVHLRNR